MIYVDIHSFRDASINNNFDYWIETAKASRGCWGQRRLRKNEGVIKVIVKRSTMDKVQVPCVKMKDSTKLHFKNDHDTTLFFQKEKNVCDVMMIW